MKTSPNLSGIWAEADKGYDDGIMVKCSVPHQPILQFFIEVCGFSKLLDFAEKRIPLEDDRFQSYLKQSRKRIQVYKCEEIQTSMKGYICGYFRTSKDLLAKVGKKLPYLGEVREERFLIPVKDLHWEKEKWHLFCKTLVCCNMAVEYSS